MNPKSKELLDKVLSKNPDELNKDEVAFLRARRSYLKNSQLEEYSSVLQTPQGTVKKHGSKTK